MIRQSLFLVVCMMLLLSGCQQQNPEEQLEQLSGYWEVQSVTLEDGTVKNYTANTTIDFIELDGTRGVRKKLAPSFDGSYSATKSAERFSTEITDKALQLHYSTAYDQWTETVLKAKDSLLVVQNADGKTYSYKRYVPLNLNLDDE